MKHKISKSCSLFCSLLFMFQTLLWTMIVSLGIKFLRIVVQTGTPSFASSYCSYSKPFSEGCCVLGNEVPKDNVLNTPQLHRLPLIVSLPCLVDHCVLLLILYDCLPTPITSSFSTLAHPTILGILCHGKWLLPSLCYPIVIMSIVPIAIAIALPFVIIIIVVVTLLTAIAPTLAPVSPSYAKLFLDISMIKVFAEHNFKRW